LAQALGNDDAGVATIAAMMTAWELPLSGRRHPFVTA